MENVRLIDANAAARNTDKEIYWTESAAAAVRNFLAHQPTIDPESLSPKGRWILTNEDYEFLICSLCGNAYYTGAETYARADDHLTYAGGYRYCPNCGAKMNTAE